MSTHNIGFYTEAILMSTHNIGFYEEITVIVALLENLLFAFACNNCTQISRLRLYILKSYSVPFLVCCLQYSGLGVFSPPAHPSTPHS